MKHRKSIAAGTLVAISATLLVFVAAPALFAPSQSPDYGPSAVEKGRHDARTSALQLLAGLVLAAGGIFTARTVRLNQESNRLEQDRNERERQGHITDRYSSAVALLGHEQDAVRVGGVYALERLARYSEEVRTTILYVLHAHARSSTRGRRVEHIKPDVEAAVIVLARLREPGDSFELVLDGVELSHARLREINLNESRLRGSNLHSTLLDHAKLINAKLKNADLSEAHLHGADLSGAELDGATLKNARYDAATKWPAGFDPRAAGALHRP